jgi:CDP-diacylglycerol--serine O-phosphatidyltransferase
MANLITSGSLAAGFLAVMLAAEGRLNGAAVLVGGAAVLDAVDGPVARRTSVSKRFGCNLDSLADLVAFGVAPALMLHRGVLHAVPVLGAGACLAFLLAGAWRLARFPLVEDRHRFVGMPIPPAGVIAAAAATLAPPTALTLVLTLVLALLMVSAIPFPTLFTLRRLARRRGRAAFNTTGVGNGSAARGPRGAGNLTSWPARWRPRRPARASGRRRRRARP